MGEHCNVHVAGMRHGPWCASNVAFPAALARILAVQAFVSFRRANWRWPTRLALALAAFPAAGLLAAGISGLLTGYWRS